MLDFWGVHFQFRMFLFRCFCWERRQSPPSRQVVERFARAKCSDPSCTEVAGGLVSWLVGWVGSLQIKGIHSNSPFENCVFEIFWEKNIKEPSENWRGSLKKGDGLGCYAFRGFPRGAFSGCLAVGCRELFLNLGGWIPYPPKKQLELSGSQLQIQCLWRKFAVQKTVGTLCYFGGFLLYTDPRCFNLMFCIWLRWYWCWKQYPGIGYFIAKQFVSILSS